MSLSILTDTTMSVLMIAMIVPALAALVAFAVDLVRNPSTQRRPERVTAPVERHARPRAIHPSA